MSNIIRPTLHELDRDGAIAEAASRVDPVTRGAFLRRALAITGGAVAVAAVPGGFAASSAFAQSSSDIDILNYALTLEYLEAAFYKEANAKAGLKDQLKRFGETVGEHEDAHVAALEKALGSKAVKKPSFDFKGTTSDPDTFATTAKTLEDTGVSAYQGQATNIKNKDILATALTIHPVEARHAAWVTSILGNGSGSPSPSPTPLNPALTMDQVLAAVQATGFISTASSAEGGSSVSGQPAMTG